MGVSQSVANPSAINNDEHTPLVKEDKFGDIEGSNADEIAELEAIQRRERSCSSQWAIQLQILCLTLCSMTVNLIRGSPKTDSIIGIDKCGGLSWSLLIGFTLFLVLV